MTRQIIDTTLNAGDTAKVAFDKVNANDAELYSTSPTANEKGAMTNANNPSAGNTFITQADLVGGLPTGQIPNNFTNYDSDISGLQTTTSSTFVDITGMDLTITTSSAIPIVAYFTYTASKTGGGSDTTAAFRISRIDGDSAPEYSLGMQATMNTGSSTENGHVTFRTTISLVAGTYTFRPQFRRVSGIDAVQFVRGQFFVEAMQAPKGDSGNVNSIATDVDFGFASGGLDFIATSTVSASWATSSSIIICTPSGIATADHDTEDYSLDGITAFASNVVDGVGFDIVATSNSGTFGIYKIKCIGV